MRLMKRYIQDTNMITRFRASVLTALGLILTLTACVDEYNAELPDEEVQLLVVDGSISTDKICTFRLTHTRGLNAFYIPSLSRPGYGTEIPYVTGAKIMVCGSDGSQYVGKEKSSIGTYEVPVGTLKPNCKYWVNIVTKDGLIYESEPTEPLDALGLTLHYEQNQKDSKDMAPVQIYVTTQPSSTPYYVNWNFEEWWEVQTPEKSKYEFKRELGGGPNPFHPREQAIDHGWGNNKHTINNYVSSAMYADNSIKNYLLHTIPCTSPLLSTCYYIKVYQEAISQAEYEYEMAREKQTSQMGGLFAPLPSRLPTNIHCKNADKGVIGFVGVRGRSSTAEMYLSSQQVKYFELREIEIVYPPEDMKDKDMFEKMEYYADLNAQGYYVLDYSSSFKDYLWISRWCVDCRSWGATQFDKPAFWNPPFNL